MPSIAVWAPGSSAARYNSRASERYRISLTSVDLPGPADARHRDERAERKRDVDVLEVVRPAAAHDELAPSGRPARFRSRDLPRAAKVLAGERLARRRNELLRRSLKHHDAAVLAGARPKIDQVVGGSHRLLVMLDDEHGVAEIAKAAQRREQTAVVALVQSDRRLVQHVQHARELRPNLRRQADPLPFPARKRGRAAPERQVADADVHEKAEPVANLAQHATRRSGARAPSVRRSRTAAGLERSATAHTQRSAGPSRVPRGSRPSAGRRNTRDTAAGRGSAPAPPDRSTSLRRNGGADSE